VDTTIHLIKFYPLNNAILVSLLLIHWIVIYPVDSINYWINLYPLNNAIGFPNTYPLDSVIQGEHYPKFEQPDPNVKPVALTAEILKNLYFAAPVM